MELLPIRSLDATPPAWLIPPDAMLSWRQAGMEEEADHL